jgi:sarcosine oxidase subunit beta
VGDVLADLVIDGDTATPLHAFSISRFAAVGAVSADSAANVATTPSATSSAA